MATRYPPPGEIPTFQRPEPGEQGSCSAAWNVPSAPAALWRLMASSRRQASCPSFSFGCTPTFTTDAHHRRA